MNELLEAVKETKERFSKFLKENYLDDSIGDDELLSVWSNWSVMDKEIQSLKEREARLVLVIKLFIEGNIGVDSFKKNALAVLEKLELING